MAFTIEDGSGVPGANAYLVLADFRTHHTDRGNTAHSDFTDTDAQAGIIRASEYVDKRFGVRFVGLRKTKGQGLEWPRFDAFDRDGYLVTVVPFQIEKAVAEYALRALICGVLAPDPILPVPKQDLTDSSGTRNTDVITGEISKRKDKVGPLEETREYVTRSQAVAANLGAGARSVQSSLVNDFNIPEYPEADFVGPRNAVDAGVQVFLFIERRDDHRNLVSIRHVRRLVLRNNIPKGS